MQYRFCLFILINFFAAILPIQSSQEYPRHYHGNDCAKYGCYNKKSVPKQSEVSPIKIARFKEFGVTMVENKNKAKKQRKEELSKFYVPDALDPYADLVKIVPGSQELLVKLFPNIHITKKEQRILGIKLFQSIFKVSNYEIVDDKYYTAIQIPQIPEEERIYMVLKENESDADDPAYELQYDGLLKHCDLPTIDPALPDNKVNRDKNRNILFKRKKLSYLNPFKFLNKEFTQVVTIDKPIFTFIPYDLQKMLKITTTPEGLYIVQYVNEAGKIELTIKTRDVVLGKFVSDITGKIEIIMRITMKVRAKKTNQYMQQKQNMYTKECFVFVLIDAKYHDGNDCYLAESLVGNIKNKRTYELKYCKFTLMQRLATWFSSDDRNNALIRVNDQTDYHYAQDDGYQIVRAPAIQPLFNINRSAYISNQAYYDNNMQFSWMHAWRSNGFMQVPYNNNASSISNPIKPLPAIMYHPNGAIVKPSQATFKVNMTNNIINPQNGLQIATNIDRSCVSNIHDATKNEGLQSVASNGSIPTMPLIKHQDDNSVNHNHDLAGLSPPILSLPPTGDTQNGNYDLLPSPVSLPSLSNIKH